MSEKYVYKITNTKNNKVYIGITSCSISRRKSDHLSKANKGYSGKLYEAIATYGKEAFKWEQIDTATTNEELAEKEVKYIEENNSLEDGYNSNAGGGIMKPIYHYNDRGELINEFKSLTAAANFFNLSTKRISRICLSVNKKINNEFLSYKYKTPFVLNRDKRKKEVLQLSLGGDEINSFLSISEASRITGVCKSGIAKVCRGERKSCAGYLWSYK